MGFRLIDITTGAGTAHTNSTTETSLYKRTFAGAELRAGKVYECVGISRATATNGADTLTMAVRFGTNATTPTSNTAIATSTAVDAVNNDISVVRGKIIVQSATRYVLAVYMCDPDAEGEAVLAFHAIFVAVAETAYTLDITADWSAADVGDSVQAEAAYVAELT